MYTIVIQMITENTFVNDKLNRNLTNLFQITIPGTKASPNIKTAIKNIATNRKLTNKNQ